MSIEDEKWYLGWINSGLFGGGNKVPCLCRGIIGVNIDPEYAKRFELKETTKQEYQKVVEEFDKTNGY